MHGFVPPGRHTPKGKPKVQAQARDGGNAAAVPSGTNEYIRLAAELNDCMRFQPKKWRHVMQESTAILHSNSYIFDGTNAKRDHSRPDRYLHAAPPRTRGMKRRSMTGNDGEALQGSQWIQRQQSRGETDAADSGDKGDGSTTADPALRRADSDTCRAGRGQKTSILPDLRAQRSSLANYLNQPALVTELMREASAADSIADKTANQTCTSTNNTRSGELVAQSAVSVKTNDSRKESPPIDVINDLNGMPTEIPTRTAVSLPILSTVSPRTRSELARLPTLNPSEMRAVQELERLVEQGGQRQLLYAELKRVVSSSAYGLAIAPQKRGERRRKMAVKERNGVDARSGDTDQRTNPDPRPTDTISPVADQRARIAKRQRSEQVLMALNDFNAAIQCEHLSVPPTAPFVVPTSLPRIVQSRLRADHDHLIRQLEASKVHSSVSGARIDRSLTEIKQWIPLEVIYAHGLGTFASPAQQHAAQLLFRVGTRLKNNIMVQAMDQWQSVVLGMREAAMASSTIGLQCWWRQILAVRALEKRRRLKRELERRQRDLMRALADRKHKSAFLITRLIRQYGANRMRERHAREDDAVRILQRFWRQQQALWIALRNRIRKKKRSDAAKTIQRRVRGVLSRVYYRLLVKVRHVEQCLADKQSEKTAIAITRKNYGAAIVIQRGFRLWVKQRLENFRRRRAQFDRDKQKILLIQARFRGRQSRKTTRLYYKRVAHATLVIQCAWRSFLAMRCLHEALRRSCRSGRSITGRTSSNRGAKNPPPENTVISSKVKHAKSHKTKSTPPNAKEVTASTKLQALWRGFRLRRRLRHERAHECELLRRKVIRQRKFAAILIQRRIRGILGRVLAWEMVINRSASRIQRLWRGFITRQELKRTHRAVKAIEKMQKAWRSRRSQERQFQRVRAVRQIQGVMRRCIGRAWVGAILRRRQYLSEEQALGKTLLASTQKRVQNDLLLQSFTMTTVETKSKQATLPQDTAVSDARDDVSSVKRSLYTRDLVKQIWKRRGYDGIWQELYRDVTGNSLEIDNSHFARFLKSLPGGFVNPHTFPSQNIDVIFTKMKEPKARAIPFAKFNKAMIMVWQEKFTSPQPSGGKKSVPASGESSAQTQNASSGSPQTTSGTSTISTQQKCDWYLRFMHVFVLPSTLQSGKYRGMLATATSERLAWAVRILRRFANRVAERNRHDKFIIAYKKIRAECEREHAAKVFQRLYRRYRYRVALKTALAAMFIEFVNHKGRSVRFQHLVTRRVVTKRPIFLHGVKCKHIVPLPLPGEQFRAFCERHETSEPRAERIPACTYCVECEEAMCSSCFSRDHDKRLALSSHERRIIAICSHCKIETATRECRQCGNGKVPFCDVCFPFVHDTMEVVDDSGTITVGATHRYQPLVVMCIDCDVKVAQWMCDVCQDAFCKRCLSRVHAKGERQSHHCHRLSYFSLLKANAARKRNADALRRHEQKCRDRIATKLAEEGEYRHRMVCATKIQAVIRSHLQRRHGKRYMKLVRQTQVAKAQRLRDEPIRTSWGYKIKSVVGLAPTLKSDTREEIEARQERFESIRKSLFYFLRRDADDNSTDFHSPQKKTKRWTKRARAEMESAAATWCVYGVQIKVLRGEWKNCMGSILSTQNLTNTGYVLIFLPQANRSVVVNWKHISPHDQDEMSRQPYVPPTHILRDGARDFRNRISSLADEATRRARLLYLQGIEFHDIVQYAWVVEFNKFEQKEEYWNVVLNKRTFNAPKAMELVERMEPDARESLDKRVDLAKKKLVHLLNPRQPRDKVKLAARRLAVVQLAKNLMKSSDEKYRRLRDETDACNCARFWHEKIIPNKDFGGRAANKFLSACSILSPAALSSASRPTTTDCWLMTRMFQWVELQQSDKFTLDAKAFFKKSSDDQTYIVSEIRDALEKNDMEAAYADFSRLIKLNEETFHLLVHATAQQKEAEANESS